MASEQVGEQAAHFRLGVLGADRDLLLGDLFVAQKPRRHFGGRGGERLRRGGERFLQRRQADVGGQLVADRRRRRRRDLGRRVVARRVQRQRVRQRRGGGVARGERAGEAEAAAQRRDDAGVVERRAAVGRAEDG